MILAINLNEGGRQTIAVLLVILHVITLLGAVGLCTVGFFLRFTLQSKVSLVEGYDGNVLPIVLMVVGGLTALVNLAGSKVAFDVGNPANRKRLRSLLMVILVLLIVVLIALLTAGSMCFAHRHHLSRSFHNGLIKAMGKYHEDSTLKYDIDMLQIKNTCCGNNGYEDWFDVQWINNNFLDISNSKIQSKMTTGKYLTDDVPFSCCRPKSPRPCIHHQVQDNDIHYNYDYQTDLTLHPVGCKEQLMEYFGSKFNQLGAASFGLLGVQVLALLLARYLQTSIAGAIAEGDPEAPTPGFLCPGGDGPPPPPKGDGPKPKKGGGDVPSGKDKGGLGGSMEDFEDHDLDAEEGYDTLLDDSTFDEEFDEPVTAYASNQTKSYNPYENDGQYGSEPIYENIKLYESEPIYENINQYESESPYEEPIRRDEEHIYDDIPAYVPTAEEDLYENIPAYAPPPIDDFYDSMQAYAPGGMADFYDTAPDAPLPPMLPSGPPDAPMPPALPSGPPPKRPGGPPPKRPEAPPPQRPKGAPPSRPATGPPKRPDGPPSSKKASPKKQAPPRPSKPPSQSSPGGKTKAGKKGPPRPDKPPSKKAGSNQPKTSTPKKSAPKQSPKKSVKSSPKRGGSASPSKKKGSAKTKQTKSASTRQSKASPKSRSPTKSKTSPKSKSVKRKPMKSPKRSPQRSSKRSPKKSPKRSPKRSPTKSMKSRQKSMGKTKSAPKWKKGSAKAGKGRSPVKRGGTKMKRSRNRNNNIVESSESETSYSGSSDTEETISSTSSSESSSLDLETGSISGDSDEWDTSISSDTPLLR
ncbi:trithorax group protein osa-like [Lytechinus variegatus]|uniref:trithorax group protein osa-like n=1 Tax=Lytechinus variegatus TaxID=7654 RepID=UPI001BB168EF|nr:trithorax group protein osa-like [Lytechinus variegatus]